VLPLLLSISEGEICPLHYSIQSVFQPTYKKSNYINVKSITIQKYHIQQDIHIVYIQVTFNFVSSFATERDTTQTLNSSISWQTKVTACR
jgi:hypothetical protein